MARYDYEGYHGEDGYSDRDDFEGLAQASAGALSAVDQKVAETRTFLTEIDDIGVGQPYDYRTGELLETLPVLTDMDPLREHEAERVVQLLASYISSTAENRQRASWELHELFESLMVRRAGRRRRTPGTGRPTEDDERYAAAIAAIERVNVLDRADRTAKEAESSLSRIEEVERAARRATGDVSAYSLAQYYEGQADREGQAANVLRFFAILLMVGAAAIVILTPLGRDLEGPELFRRIAFGVPAVLLSGYFARESSQHRYVSRELRSTEIRLRTLWGFAEGLPDEATRVAFLDRVGSMIFTSPTAQPGERQTASSADAEGLLRQLVELLRAAATAQRAGT